MTENSRPWDGTTVGDATIAPYDAGTEWAEVHRALSPASERTANKGGVIVGATGFNDYTTTSTGVNNARVQTGIGFVQGTWHRSDANVDLVIPTPAVSTRVDRIVLRKSWAGQTVRITRVAGTEGAGTPALTQTFGTTWDVPLYLVSITTGGTITFTDQRESLSGTPPPSTQRFVATASQTDFVVGVYTKVWVYKNGLRMSSAGNDYTDNTPVAGTIRFAYTLALNDVVLVDLV